MENEDSGLQRPRSRNVCSLDMATSSTREACKAAAWMWHMHSSSPTPKTEGEDIQESKRRSNSCDRRDSRFRQEASLSASASASASKSAAPKRLASTSPNIWDCGSKLYDTFELVSFSNRLDRSLLGVVPPAFDAPSFHHAVQSPLHHRGFAGVLRTFSVPRTLSVNKLIPVTHPSYDDGNHVKPQDGMVNSSVNGSNSSPVSSHVPLGDLDSTFGPSTTTTKRKFSTLRRALMTKWHLSKIVKIYKKVAKLHKQMHCFQMRAKNVMTRSKLISNKDDDGGGMSEHRYFWRCASCRDKKTRRRTSGELLCVEDDDDGLSKHWYRVYEEKVNEGKGSKHFHHHHHHYHHHFVHHLDQFSQASKEDNICKHRSSGNGIRADAKWPAGPPTRTESARLSSDTMSKICADANWL
ncbi:hypothetical protein L7F22_061566 [Adiantum nelumboides]|nr:hypothetical protein [Adiantum nelumboides]